MAQTWEGMHYFPTKSVKTINMIFLVVVCVCVCVSSIVDVVVFELVFVLCVFPSIGVSGRGVGNSCKHRNLSEAAEIIHHNSHPELNICAQ